MLLKENVRLRRIASGTWKNALLIIFICLLSAALNQFFLKKYIEFPSIFPSLLGTALAFFIGFNNNQAYARWWEARIIYGGVSGLSRSLARQCVSYIAQRPEVEKMVYRQIAFVYALKAYLRNTDDKSYEKFFHEGVPAVVMKAQSKYNAILLLQQQHLEEIYSKGYIDSFKFMQLNETFNGISGEMGKAERIKNTVFPTTYTFYTKLFIWIFIVSVTVVLNNTIGWASVILGFVIGYVYYITYTIGQTLLNPFVLAPTGVALDRITRATEIDLKEVLGEENLPEQTSVISGEYIT